jgi:hypothetical protein
MDEQILIILVDGQLTTRQIASLLEVSHVTIIRKMKKLGLVSFHKRKKLSHRKTCLFCNKNIKSGTYCNRKCSSNEMSRTYLEDWKVGKNSGGNLDNLSAIVRKFLIKEAGEMCSLCGWKEINQHTNRVPLTINHINGNPYDHSIDNLEVLCPNCHSLTATYGGRNKGNGRRERLKKLHENKKLAP